MLKILNDLTPFIEDNYREYGVREYARIAGVSPPTASKTLKELGKEGILLSRNYRNLILFRANRESKTLKSLSVTYWQEKLKELSRYLSEELNYPKIILFGSLIKLEAKEDSDIDIYLDREKADIQLDSFEKKLKRKIQLHFRPEMKNINLKNNIEKGAAL
jgi:predicted nucleotidyltransferase